MSVTLEALFRTNSVDPLYSDTTVLEHSFGVWVMDQNVSVLQNRNFNNLVCILKDLKVDKLSLVGPTSKPMAELFKFPSLISRFVN